MLTCCWRRWKLAKRLSRSWTSPGLLATRRLMLNFGCLKWIWRLSARPKPKSRCRKSSTRRSLRSEMNSSADADRLAADRDKATTTAVLTSRAVEAAVLSRVLSVKVQRSVVATRRSLRSLSTFRFLCRLLSASVLSPRSLTRVSARSRSVT